MIEWPNDFNRFFDIRDKHRRHSSIKVKTNRYRFSPATQNLREMYESMLQVYTDRLIYAKESLFAVEAVLCQRDDVSCFNYRDREGSDDIFHSRHNRANNYLLVYNYTKTHQFRRFILF